ncbi:cell division protein FtsQ/DivIB [Ruminococcus sp. zg-924]|uniref:cell division protein FtsQ/DivIB n=1 Tax=Ruminococcus sp. zg-924 TaxID=2678505 RepID=UPI002108788A|nr:FtsQ-type POTRA domain-containing protein [Ruminococcus sp. zg-924]MCQ4022339.1 FtsQ-type POTRA domain-containing protein [Ruminococcus sp. zg-924]
MNKNGKNEKEKNEKNDKTIKNKNRPYDSADRRKASGSSRQKRESDGRRERSDDAFPKRKREEEFVEHTDKQRRKGSSSSKLSGKERENSESADRQSNIRKRKKPSADSKGKKRRDKAQKHIESENLIDKKDYGDEFYTDELELKRIRARQRIDEKLANDSVIEKKPMSHKRRKLKNIGVAASIVSIIFIIGIVLSLTVFFRCEQFLVEGAEHYSAQDIIDASGMSLGENLFLSDKSAGEEKIESSLPFIEEANISVRIPNTMLITVTESKPAFIVSSGNDYIVVSSKGKVMEKIQGKTDKYDAPLVLGCTVKSSELGREIKFKEPGALSILKAISAGLEENEFSGIKEIDISNTARICLNYSNRIKIIIGLPEDISYKLKTAKIIISEKLSETDTGELDVSGCKEKNKASYFKPDPSIYIDRIQETQPATEPTTEALTQTQTEQEAQTDIWTDAEPDSADDDYSNGVPMYEYPTDEYGNVISSTDSESQSGYDNYGY